tara:strand:- start:1261 stop:2721 length:1461 start_codon:yes stop_codon:yes gene_type:complete
VSDICFQPAWRQMEALNLGTITSVELLNLHVDQFNRVNKTINAVIKTDLERARQHANALDRMRADGKILGPLHGLPMTIKDTFDVDNMPATAGAPEFANRARPVEDANVVMRVKASGGLIWGKTNVPYLAGEWQSFNRLFGQTNNPYNLDVTPGGSSGGSAAALASGITPVEIGSDIGGSLRIPSHFTGVCALKPTFGLVSQHGHVPPSPEYAGEVDLNVVGPMARTVRDLKIMRSVIQAGATATQSGFALSLENKRLAVWSEQEEWPLSTAVQEVISSAVRELEASEAEVVRVKPDVDPKELMDVYLGLLIPVVAMDMPQLRSVGLKLLRPILKRLQKYEKSQFTDGNWAVKATLSHHEWMQIDGRRAALKRILRDFFKSYDALIMPISATPAIPHNTRGTVLERFITFDGKSHPYATHLNWISLASALHLPAVSIPAGRTPSGLPVGIQIIGPQNSDARLLDIAEAIEGLLGGYRRPTTDLGVY